MVNYAGFVISMIPIIGGLVLFTLVILGYAFTIWMLIDCLQRDSEEFPDKTLWSVLLIIGMFAQYSLLLSIIYYFIVKKKLDN